MKVEKPDMKDFENPGTIDYVYKERKEGGLIKIDIIKAIKNVFKLSKKIDTYTCVSCGQRILQGDNKKFAKMYKENRQMLITLIQRGRVCFNCLRYL